MRPKGEDANSFSDEELDPYLDASSSEDDDSTSKSSAASSERERKATKQKKKRSRAMDAYSGHGMNYEKATYPGYGIPSEKMAETFEDRSEKSGTEMAPYPKQRTAPYRITLGMCWLFAIASISAEFAFIISMRLGQAVLICVKDDFFGDSGSSGGLLDPKTAKVGSFGDFSADGDNIATRVASTSFFLANMALTMMAIGLMTPYAVRCSRIPIVIPGCYFFGVLASFILSLFCGVMSLMLSYTLQSSFCQHFFKVSLQNPAYIHIVSLVLRLLAFLCSFGIMLGMGRLRDVVPLESHDHYQISVHYIRAMRSGKVSGVLAVVAFLTAFALANGVYQADDSNEWGAVTTYDFFFRGTYESGDKKVWEMYSDIWSFSRIAPIILAILFPLLVCGAVGILFYNSGSGEHIDWTDKKDPIIQVPAVPKNFLIAAGGQLFFAIGALIAALALLYRNSQSYSDITVSPMICLYIFSMVMAIVALGSGIFAWLFWPEHVIEVSKKRPIIRHSRHWRRG